MELLNFLLVQMEIVVLEVVQILMQTADRAVL